MAGELTPLVMLPRYTSYIGAQAMTTMWMDVTEYQSAIVNVWRGKLIGSSTPTVGFYFEESTDQVGVLQCVVNGASSAPYDPGEETEDQYVAALTRRWFRMRIVLGGTDPGVTCWGVGFLESRIS